MAWSISLCASDGCQLGVSYSAPIFTLLLSNTECAPCLKSLALLSVGAPLIITMVPPSALAPSFLISELACSSPTLALS